MLFLMMMVMMVRMVMLRVIMAIMTSLNQNECHGKEEQLWDFEEAQNGIFRNKTGFVADVKGSSGPEVMMIIMMMIMRISGNFGDIINAFTPQLFLKIHNSSLFWLQSAK